MVVAAAVVTLPSRVGGGRPLREAAHCGEDGRLSTSRIEDNTLAVINLLLRLPAGLLLLRAVLIHAAIIMLILECEHWRPIITEAVCSDGTVWEERQLL